MTKKNETDTIEGRLEAETLQEKKRIATGKALEYLCNAPSPTTRPKVTSLALNFRGDSFMITMKRASGEGPQVCFVVSKTPSMTIRKAAALARKKELPWRLDQWALDKFDSEEEGW